MIDKQHDMQGRKLWNDFLAGDDEAFGLLYTMYVHSLYNYGQLFVADSEWVKDCVQDLFVKLYTTRPRLPAVEHVRTYLYQSLKNILISALKKEKNCDRIDAIQPVFHMECSVESQLIETEQHDEQRQRIARIMKDLTPRQQEVLYYRFAEELSYEEICRLMQMNYQSVRNLIHRTILKIRNAAADDKR